MTLGLSGSDKCVLAYFPFFYVCVKRWRTVNVIGLKQCLPVFGPTGRDLFARRCCPIKSTLALNESGTHLHNVIHKAEFFLRSEDFTQLSDQKTFPSFVKPEILSRNYDSLSRILPVTDPIWRRKTPFAGRLLCDILTLNEQLPICSPRHGGWIAVPEEKDIWRSLLNAVVSLRVP
jgi:hypothetical protein